MIDDGEVTTVEVADRRCGAAAQQRDRAVRSISALSPQPAGRTVWNFELHRSP
jgi:hypothetical protein